MPADLPPARLALEPSESLDPVEWEGTEPCSVGDRHARRVAGVGMAVLLLVGAFFLVLLT